MKIQILGTGCPKCKKLANVADLAAQQLDLDYELEKVTDIQEIVALGVMSTPALVVDKVVKLSGRVPGLDEMKTILAQ